MTEPTASQQIDTIISKAPGWKSSALADLRRVVTSAAPELVEEVKWKTASRPEGLPVWSSNGIVCIAEIWKDNIKLIFFKGVHLDDPSGLFNARLKSRTDRAIELREGDEVDEPALTNLVQQAVALNHQ